jgi:hypothetical protein
MVSMAILLITTEVFTTGFELVMEAAVEGCAIGPCLCRIRPR